jgi:hypothetical protein
LLKIPHFAIPVGMFKLSSLVALFFGVFLSARAGEIGPDDAEILSRRIPDQSYNAYDEFSLLWRGKLEWYIVLWACDSASFEINKVLGNTAPAPYAVKITPKGDHPMDAYPYLGRVRTIHLLAASLEDAIKIRRALIFEVEIQQRHIEKRQGNSPGHLKRVVQSWKR